MNRLGNRRILTIVLPWLAFTVPALSQEAGAEGQESPKEDAEEAIEEAVEPDEVTTKDGSVIIGTVESMGDGTLKVNTPFGGVISVKWSEVKSLKTNRVLPFVQEDNILSGTASTNDQGQLVITSEALGLPVPVDPISIVAINPPEVKSVTINGNVNAGLSISDGNTRTKSGSVLAEFVARTDKTRTTLRGSYNYADTEDGLTARNGKGSIKYDYFVKSRLFLYVSALFENDKFQDMNLRTALSGGPGYQIFEKGDLEGEYVQLLETYGELGISYFDEDRRRGEDDNYVAGRWALKIDWPFLPDRVTFFHYHEGFPGFENLKDLYVTTEQGLRFNLIEGFTASLQINWRWDNTPSPGFRRSDTQYLFTLGYVFDA